MKKFLLIGAIALLSFTATMAAKTNVVPQDDVGYVIPNTPTFEVINVTFEAWQAPVMLNKVSEQSAQVISTYSDLVLPIEVISEKLVQFKWPHTNSEFSYNYSNLAYYNINNASPTNAYYENSFMVQRTELI